MTGRPPTAGAVRVGVGPSTGVFRSRAEADAFAGTAAEVGLDHLFSADHVSFRGGMGVDGIVQIGWLLGRHPALAGNVGVYLLALRHPTVVARQLATLAVLAPGRFTLGVGVGGEDRHEIESAGVDPATRGRRTDACLEILRALLAGEPVSHRSEFFALRDVRITPAPDPPIPIVIGGRSDAALRRAAAYGEGWLGVWCSPRRFAAATRSVEEQALSAGRAGVPWQHGLQVWIGVADSAAEARARVAPAMEATYGVPFERFARYTPAGPPDEIARALRSYVAAGCRLLNLCPVGGSAREAVRAMGEVKRLL